MPIFAGDAPAVKPCYGRSCGKPTFPPGSPCTGDLDWLGYPDLISLGLSRRTARRVLGPHSAIHHNDLAERLALLDREGGRR
jgi:hypothetical protein